jgi:hypothetical protein
MKTSSKLFVLGMLLMGFGVSANAQVTASASSTATIVTPIGITKMVDMNFGNVAVSGTAGSVVLAPAGTRTIVGGTTLPTVGGTITAASFDVVGQGSYTYSITLPTTDLTLTRTGFSETMVVNAFTSTPSGTGALNVGGAQTLKVGATLNVSANQVAGTYTSLTPFDVTVNYN